MNAALIEQIVANVLQQLQPTSTARPASVPPTSTTTETWLDLPVITAETLQHKVQPGQRLQIAAHAVLTPSARDWLKAHGVIWQRASRTAGDGRPSGIRWFLVGTMTPATRSLVQVLPREFPDWTGQPCTPLQQLVEAAVQGLSTGAAEWVVAVSDQAAAVACRANRQSAVRAAVVSHAAEIPKLVEAMGVNLVVIDPQGKSFVELRNVLRACAASAPPRCPPGWD